MVRGFISFEGPEGCTKTTQIGMLYERLKTEGYSCIKTKEPGGTPTAEKIREILLDSKNSIDPFSELLLFGITRREHVVNVIRPALKRGDLVLSDRFKDSTVAYQGYARGMRIADINWMHEMILEGVTPNITVTYTGELPVMLALARERNKAMMRNGGIDEDRFEKEAYPFHERVHAGFLKMARAEPDRFRLITVTENGRMRSRETIHEETYAVVEKYLKRSGSLVPLRF